MNIPNNNLAEIIKEVISLCDELSSEYDNDASWFLPPASEREITEWEHERKVKIPESYREWLLFSNGSQIQGNTARFYGLKEIKIYDEYIPENYIVMGELIGDGELLCFSKTTGKIIRYNHGKTIEYQNFKEVLNLILNII